MPLIVPVAMPQMGESLSEGTLVRWLKQVGEPVAQDEPLFEISTDKVDTEVPSPVAGVLREQLVREGDTVNVGVPVAMVASEAVAGASTSPSGASAPATKSSAGASAACRTAPAVASSDANRTESAPAVVASGSSRPSPDAGTKDKPEEPAGHFKSSHAAQTVSFRQRTAQAQPADRPSARTYTSAVLDAARHGGVPLGTLTTMTGSGRGGRVTKRDVERYLAEGPRGGESQPRRAEPAASDPSTVPADFIYQPRPEDRVVPMTPVRKRIARHMSWSARISPHATAFAECDMTAASALVARSKTTRASDEPAITYTVLGAEAVLAALREFPTLNASVVGDTLVLKPSVHLGIAVALPDSDELIVPVIHRADELSRSGLARAIGDLASRARDRRLTPDDVQGGTFTLTNPGIFGGTTGTPILNQPQVAILGLGAVTKRAVVIDDAIAIRPMMSLSLTIDHRASDGMHAFRFLDAVRKRLETLG